MSAILRWIRLRLGLWVPGPEWPCEYVVGFQPRQGKAWASVGERCSRPSTVRVANVPLCDEHGGPR